MEAHGVVWDAVLQACANVTVCSSEGYETSAPTVLADRVCKPRSVYATFDLTCIALCRSSYRG